MDITCIRKGHKCPVDPTKPVMPCEGCRVDDIMEMQRTLHGAASGASLEEIADKAIEAIDTMYGLLYP